MVERVLHSPRRYQYDNGEANSYGKKILNQVKEVVSDATFILGIMGFFIGRASIMEVLSPFGVAFLVSVAMLTRTKNTTIIGTSIIMGLLTRISGYQTIQSILSIMLIFLSVKIFKLDDKTSTLKAGAIAFAVNFGTSLLMSILTNGALILYDTLMGLFNSMIVMALVYIYNFGLPLILERKSRSILSNEEVICLSIICAIVISGLADITAVGVSFKVVMSIAVIIIAAYGQGSGVGAAIGTTIGLITSLSSSQAPIIMGTYAFCGLISGVFKDMGKTGTVAGFIIADVVMQLYLGTDQSAINIKELIAGIALFIVFPSSVIGKIMPFINSAARSFIEQQSYVERMKDLIRARITHVTDVFIELSKALEENEGTEKLRQNGEINSIINSVVDKVCADCDARGICWNRDFYRTYQNMFEMLDVIQTDGKIDMENMPTELKKRCMRASQLVKTTNYMFDIYRMNYKWRLKAREGRRVVGEQLVGVSDILKKLSDDVRQEVDFKGDVEEELAVALDKEGVRFNDVVVVKDDTGKYEVNIYKRACLGRRECVKDVGPLVSKVLKKRMKRDKASCMVKEGTNLCYFKLVEAVKYQVSTGIAREIKDRGGVSGDNYSFIELDNGKYMMALSDGMGTGPAAAMESNSAITLLEKYLEAGFDRATALKAINSVISIRSPEDNFTTIDLAVIDLYSGSVDIIKAGAASTFIKRADGSIEVLSSTSLPIGILNNVDIETKSVALSHGDLIVMLTDGVEEAVNADSKQWLLNALERIESRNPQQVAEELLSKVKEKGGGKVMDDMTVFVSKVWEVA